VGRRSRGQPREPPRTRVQLDIVESIVGAARAVIEQGGLAAFTTNAVAERAGVSVGSLYRYFPDKEALLAELARRLERRTELVVLEIIERWSAASLAELVARIVDGLIDELGDPGVRQALRREVPSAWLLPVSERVDRSVRDRIAALLVDRDDVRDGPPEVMAWVACHAVELLVEAAVLDDPTALRSPALRGELIELVVRYLGGAPARPTDRSRPLRP
jgi:AcrR family transcriptional regulator